LILQRTNLRV